MSCSLSLGTRVDDHFMEGVGLVYIAPHRALASTVALS
jgi:hypothetical protein